MRKREREVGLNWKCWGWKGNTERHKWSTLTHTHTEVHARARVHEHKRTRVFHYEKTFGQSVWRKNCKSDVVKALACTLLEMQLAFLRGKRTYYLMRQPKDIVLHREWAENENNNLVCCRNFIFLLIIQPVSLQDDTFLLVEWIIIFFALRAIVTQALMLTPFLQNTSDVTHSGNKIKFLFLVLLFKQSLWDYWRRALLKTVKLAQYLVRHRKCIGRLYNLRNK